LEMNPGILMNIGENLFSTIEHKEPDRGPLFLSAFDEGTPYPPHHGIG
jgi:hypothetical protein